MNNNDNDTRLEIFSPSDFLRKKYNAGLVRVLKIIQEAGKDGISTTKLCEQAFKTRNYGMRVINRAYDEGYIKRFGKNKRGHNKVNYLSDKGKARSC
jgi:predicted HTH transcriptional regulator